MLHFVVDIREKPNAMWRFVRACLYDFPATRSSSTEQDAGLTWLICTSPQWD